MAKVLAIEEQLMEV